MDPSVIQDGSRMEPDGSEMMGPRWTHQWSKRDPGWNQDGSKMMGPRWTHQWSKMDPGWNQKGFNMMGPRWTHQWSKMDPWWNQEGSKMMGPIWTHQWSKSPRQGKYRKLSSKGLSCQHFHGLENNKFDGREAMITKELPIQKNIESQPQQDHLRSRITEHIPEPC